MAKSKSYLLGLYEKAMPSHLSWIEKCEAAKAAGFDYIEVSIDETDEKLSRLDYSEAQFLEIEQAVRQSQIPIKTLCLSGHRRFPLGSHDEQKRQTSLIMMEKACRFASRLGVRVIQIAGYDVYYEQADPSTRAHFNHNLGLCVKIAAKYGVILGFETMETDFMNTVHKAMFYVNQHQSPYLQVYPDIGNLTNACRISHGSIVEDLNQGRSHIVAAHVKEIIEGHYREIPFGTGDTRYEEALECLYRQGVQLLTGEFWYVGSETWQEDLAFANVYLRSKIDQFYVK